MPDYGASGKKRGYLGRIRSDWGRKQPKTCVWVSAVEGKAFLQRSQAAFLVNPSQTFNTAAHSPTSSRTQHSFFGNKRALSDGARSATSSHAPKKGYGVREVRAANLHVGVAFLLLTFLWRSKEK